MLKGLALMAMAAAANGLPSVVSPHTAFRSSDNPDALAIDWVTCDINNGDKTTAPFNMVIHVVNAEPNHQVIGRLNLDPAGAEDIDNDYVCPEWEGYMQMISSVDGLAIPDEFVLQETADDNGELKFRVAVDSCDGPFIGNVAMALRDPSTGMASGPCVVSRNAVVGPIWGAIAIMELPFFFSKKHGSDQFYAVNQNESFAENFAHLAYEHMLDHDGVHSDLCNANLGCGSVEVENRFAPFPNHELAPEYDVWDNWMEKDSEKSKYVYMYVPMEGYEASMRQVHAIRKYFDGQKDGDVAGYGRRDSTIASHEFEELVERATGTKFEAIILRDSALYRDNYIFNDP